MKHQKGRIKNPLLVKTSLWACVCLCPHPCCKTAHGRGPLGVATSVLPAGILFCGSRETDRSERVSSEGRMVRRLKSSNSVYKRTYHTHTHAHLAGPVIAFPLQPAEGPGRSDQDELDKPVRRNQVSSRFVWWGVCFREKIIYLNKYWFFISPGCLFRCLPVRGDCARGPLFTGVCSMLEGVVRPVRTLDLLSVVVCTLGRIGWFFLVLLSFRREKTGLLLNNTEIHCSACL